MATISLYVDGSCDHQRQNIHAGVVVCQRKKSIIESKTVLNTSNHLDGFEILAVISGLNIAKQMEDINSINIYSDHLSLISILQEGCDKLKVSSMYQKHKPLMHKLYLSIKHFESLKINLNFKHLSFRDSSKMRRADELSKLWKNKQRKQGKFCGFLRLKYKQPLDCK